MQIARSADALADAEAEVAVDFTVVDAARENLDWCADHGVHAVVGTTGFSAADLDDFRERFAASDANAVIAPNFAIGAVLMMRFAELAAPYFETRRDHRAPPRPEGRRAVGHRHAHRRADGRGVRRVGGRPHHHDGGRGRPRRRGRAAASTSTRCGCAAWSPTRRCCSAPPGSRSDPPRLLRPHVVHARRAARGEGGGRATRAHHRPRPAARALSPPDGGAGAVDDTRLQVLARRVRLHRPPGDGQDHRRRRRRRVRGVAGHHLPPVPGRQGRAPPRHRRLGDGPLLPRLGEELGDAADFPEFLERALPLARRELREHAVLQKVLETEPDRLNAADHRRSSTG